MRIHKATRAYEAWLGEQIPLLRSDLKRKHEQMRDGAFPFLRATFYRWAQSFPEVCPDLMGAPTVLGVGDLHVENFGTWRDIEGRLVWGVNDFDEACRLPYVSDLVRLTTSAHLAIAKNGLNISYVKASKAILDGYRAVLGVGGRPFVLAEHDPVLREMAVARLKQPGKFWKKLQALPTLRRRVPSGALKGLCRNLPRTRQDGPFRIVHRVSGLGSLGRRRYTGIAEWHGASVAREAKELAASAWGWARSDRTDPIRYQEILDRAIRSPDPFIELRGRWVIRRLAPDCSRIELSALPKRDASHLLHAMGWETANVHLGSCEAGRLAGDLRRRSSAWLHSEARAMARSTFEDWAEWRDG